MFVSSCTAFRAGDVVVGDVLLHLLEGHGLCLVVEAVRFDEVFDEVVRAVAGMAVLQSMGGSEKPPTWPDAFQTSEFMRMAASRPTLYLFLDEFLPPGAFDVVLQFDAGGRSPSCWRGRRKCRTRENEPAVLAQRDDLIHGLLVVFHCVPPAPYAGGSGAVSLIRKLS